MHTMSLDPAFLDFLKIELRSAFTEERAQACITHKITRLRDLAFGWQFDELELRDDLQFLAPLQDVAVTFCCREAEKAADPAGFAAQVASASQSATTTVPPARSTYKARDMS